MPTYELKQHANGRWYIHWTEGRRSYRVSTGQKEKNQAQIFYAHWVIDDGKASADNSLIEDLWALYFEKHLARNGKGTSSAAASWRNLGQHFKKLTSGAITQDVINDYTDARLAGRIGSGRAKHGTVRMELAMLIACLNWCARHEIIAPINTSRFTLPPFSPPRERWLRPAEFETLIGAAENLRIGGRFTRLERFLWIAIYTGSRKTAIFELTWDRVDFERLVISFERPGRRQASNKRRSQVPIAEPLMPILEKAHAERVNDYVLDSPRGITGALNRAVKAAGIPPLSPHTLRHTAATWMARRGVPIWKAAGILGITTKTLENVYAKHAPDGLVDAVAAISDTYQSEVNLRAAARNLSADVVCRDTK